MLLRSVATVSPNHLGRLGALLGLILISTAVLWQELVHTTPWHLAWFPAENALLEGTLGALAGVLLAGLIWALSQRLAALRRIQERLLETLEVHRMRWPHAVLFGLLAGIPEEMFFRGAMQPALGVWLTAMIFGALHAVSPIYFIYATGAGLALGSLATWRGDLWAATLAHISYDTTLFLLLMWHVRRNKTMIGS
ncbi:MAG: CPBP family intramembrane metalloprotease [Anaerolineae bacterium]|nr:CPBP family intramembrane metalloprotease [Anaerolineae bacterium]